MQATEIKEWLDNESLLDAIFPINRLIEIEEVDEDGIERKHPYMKRWLVQRLPNGEALYLHKIMRPDSAQSGFHDHPWVHSRSIILRGWYGELVMTGFNPDGTLRVSDHYRGEGDVNEINGNTYHRIEVISPDTPVWTLFHHGRRTKPWGFVQFENGVAKYVHMPHSDALSEWEANPDLWQNKGIPKAS